MPTLPLTTSDAEDMRWSQMSTECEYGVGILYGPGDFSKDNLIGGYYTNAG